MGFYDAFFGSDQSLYTAYSIIAAIIAICLTILLTATDVPLGNRILIVLFVILTLIPSIFLTLFELTCIVTGGTEPNRWWCHAFAWILAAFIIIYCIIVVIVSLVSLFNYNKAIYTVNNEEQKYKITNNESDNYAKEIIEADEIHTKQLEKFYGGRGYESFENVSDDGKISIVDGLSLATMRDKKGGNIIPGIDPTASPVSSSMVPSTTDIAKFTNPETPSLSSLPSLSSAIPQYLSNSMKGNDNKIKDEFQNGSMINIESQDPLVVTTLRNIMSNRQQPPPQQPPPQQQPPQQQAPKEVSGFENPTGSNIPASVNKISTQGYSNLNEGFGEDSSIIDNMYAAFDFKKFN
jgi:hypothetical protein